MLDEGDPAVVDGSMAIVDDGVPPRPRALDDVASSSRWLEHRNDVAAARALIAGGLVVDTMEVAGPWSDLPAIYDAATLAAIARGRRHAGGVGPPVARLPRRRLPLLHVRRQGRARRSREPTYYRAVWDAGTAAVLARGGALCHHHGVGLNRARFVREALGERPSTSSSR